MKYNYDTTINTAYNLGRNNNVIKKYFAITSPDENKLKLTYTYNFSIIDSVIENIVKENSKKITNAAIIKNNSGNLVVTKDKYGLSVDSESIVQAIKSKINNIDNEKDLVIISELKKIDPKIKTSDLLGVNTRISSVTTNFRYSNLNRSENIRVAAAAINGKTLMPGEVFSFNDIVGARTIDRGFKTAKEIIGNKVVDGIGGGVCQVSTTLYNAVLRTNLNSVERYQHSLKSSYIGAGLDATVAYGLLDYRFKNTYFYPIYLESSVYNKNVTFSIYSNESLNSKTYDILNERVGNSIHVSRITYNNNKFLSKVLLYTDNIH
ncbi:VanW family protein [Clostridium lacusfryxellense]|nr:VanW family protein [Clostridium lacusfryxellense]